MFRETPCSKLLILLAEIGDLEKRNMKKDLNASKIKYCKFVTLFYFLRILLVLLRNIEM